MNFNFRQITIFIIIVDVLISLIASYLSISIRTFSFENINFDLEYIFYLYILPAIIILFIFFLRGGYSNILKYNSLDDFLDIGFNVLLYAFIYLAILIYLKLPFLPRSIGILHPLIFYNLMIIFRYAVVISNRGSIKVNEKTESQSKTLIYGAGEAGVKLYSDLRFRNDYQIVGFIDDNTNIIGRSISGLKIHGKNDLKNLIYSKKIKIIILALPSIGLSERKKIINFLVNFPVKVISVPMYADIVSGRTSIRDLRPLNIEEIINRQITISTNHLKKYGNKNILITGSGGSIGSELCRQLIISNPSKIVLVDNSEFNLYSIEMELIEIMKDRGIKSKIESLLVSVVQRDEIDLIFKKFRPNYVFHAAAYKHVPMLEKNIFASLKNNLIGTINVANAAYKYNVEEFHLVSTDKAVRPTNIMGASKRLAEIYVQSYAEYKNYDRTIFSIVRFGNVLNSSGSIIPLFLKQIEKGGPVTVTHKEVTRFFMTIAEAANLILDSTSSAKNCEVFLLDMGEPVKIFDLAKKIIELSGLKVKDQNNPSGDIQIKITGLRPGEKLYEELLIDDNAIKTNNMHIFKAREGFIKHQIFLEIIEKINQSIQDRDEEKLLKVIKSSLPEFNHNQ